METDLIIVSLSMWTAVNMLAVIGWTIVGALLIALAVISNRAK